MGAEEVILAAVVANVAVNSRYCLSPCCSSVREKQCTHKAANFFKPLPNTSPSPATTGRWFR